MENLEELMELLGTRIEWNKRSLKINSISVENDGIQVYCDDNNWYYLRNGRWLDNNELDDYIEAINLYD
jgi:hypothetical protein